MNLLLNVLIMLSIWLPIGYILGRLEDMETALKVYRLELERLRKKVDDGH